MRLAHLILLALTLCPTTQALELRELGLTYHHYQPYSVFPELGGQRADQGLTLGMDVDLFGPVYWDNAIHYMTEGADSIYVGWNYRLGVRLSPGLSGGFEHFSQHMIGQPEIAPHFPLYDSVFLNWSIYQGQGGQKTLF